MLFDVYSEKTRIKQNFNIHTDECSFLEYFALPVIFGVDKFTTRCQAASE